MKWFNRIPTVDIDDLREVTRKNRMTVVMFYDHGCEVCKAQEKEFKKIKSHFKDKGVKFVKVNYHKVRKKLKDLPPDDPRKGLKMTTFPTTMVWMQYKTEDGKLMSKNVVISYDSKPGKAFYRISGKIDGDLLKESIEEMLNAY